MAHSRAASLERLRDILRSTFWLVPMVCVLISIGLALGLIALDQRLGDVATRLFPAPPEGARFYLTAIVTAMIAFTGLVFTITVVVLQLTSGQFSPRVLRIFLRDRTVRYSLGIFIATFVYAMTVLRAVTGSSNDDGFVPRIALIVSFVSVLAAVGVFIAYLARISNMIRVATIIQEIGEQGRATIARRREIEARNPGGERGDAPECDAEWFGVVAPAQGVIVSVNEESLVAVAAATDCRIEVCCRVGDFLPEGATMCTVRATPSDDERGEGRIRRAVREGIAIDGERTPEQDIAYSLRELVDITERALSPAVNDPTTGSQCIDMIHDLLRRLATGADPVTHWRDAEGRVRLVVPAYDFADMLDFVVREVWRYGHDSAQIPERMHRMLDDLGVAGTPDDGAHARAWSARLRRGEPDAGASDAP